MYNAELKSRAYHDAKLKKIAKLFDIDLNSK